MDKKSQLGFLSLTVLFTIIFSTLIYSFSGGSGTNADPWQINDCDDLNNISNFLNGNFTQTANIDCDTAPYNTGSGFDPIGGVFTGSYNGSGYTISNLHINRPTTDSVGLIGQANGSVFNNIKLINVNITGQDEVGALIGNIDYFDQEGAIINNSYVTGEVNGRGNVGGIVGRLNDGETHNSNSSVHVIGTADNIGGLIGYALHSNISNSYASGNVSGDDRVGGLVGYAEGNLNNGYFYNVSASGNIRGDEYVGGLIGHNFGAFILNSTASGSVYGNISIGGHTGLHSGSSRTPSSSASGTVYGYESNAGGFVGYCGWNCFLDNVFATGDVYGNKTVGGLIGHGYRGVNNSYATGNVNGTLNVGGLIGLLEYTPIPVDNVYSTGNVNGETIVGGLIGYLYLNFPTDKFIINSYSSSNVVGNYSVGGFVGAIVGTGNNQINNSFSTGSVTGNFSVGGFVGNASSGSFSNNFWNNHSGNPGTAEGLGSTGAIAIADNISYFYFQTSPPMNTWDNNIWNWTNQSLPYLFYQDIPSSSSVSSTTPSGGLFPIVNPITLIILLSLLLLG